MSMDGCQWEATCHEILHRVETICAAGMLGTTRILMVITEHHRASRSELHGFRKVHVMQGAVLLGQAPGRGGV